MLDDTFLLHWLLINFTLKFLAFRNSACLLLLPCPGFHLWNQGMGRRHQYWHCPSATFSDEKHLYCCSFYYGVAEPTCALDQHSFQINVPCFLNIESHQSKNNGNIALFYLEAAGGITSIDKPESTRQFSGSRIRCGFKERRGRTCLSLK